MFVANVTPVMLIAWVAVYNGEAFTAIDTALLIQAAMLIAGIGTLIQLYPVWRIGSRLPVVMGLELHVPVRHDDAGLQGLRPDDRRDEASPSASASRRSRNSSPVCRKS